MGALYFHIVGPLVSTSVCHVPIGAARSPANMKLIHWLWQEHSCANMCPQVSESKMESAGPRAVQSIIQTLMQEHQMPRVVFISSFFRTKHYSNIPMGIPLTAASNARGYEKFAILDQYLALSRKRYKIGPWLLWKVNRKPYQSFRMVPF